MAGPRRILINICGMAGKSQVQLCGALSSVLRERHSTLALVELAMARPSEEMGSLAGESPRAICPLCGDDSNNPFSIRGFAVPDGLLRHLEGSHNAIQCPVFEIACALARERFRTT
jgi:hypothetical protein